MSAVIVYGRLYVMAVEKNIRNAYIQALRILYLCCHKP